MTTHSTTFSELSLSENLLKALADLNFETPSPIQQQTIPWLLQGRDVIGKAQTGTGKTAAFSLPILQHLKEASQAQALILAPTRELAIQVAAHIEALCRYQRGVRVAVLCGGQDYRHQIKSLRDGAQIVVGTPGRILDHLERGTLQTASLSTFVLDEADEMLRMGFVEDVEAILAQLPEKRQIALFSATMPARIRQIANNYLNDPVSIEIRTETATVKSIEQRFLFASQSEKSDALLRILATEDHQGAIVFVRTKTGTEEVADVLQQYGHRAMAIHGDLTQPLRERIITQFKQGIIDVLVATDVAARGLDVERVTHVINYDMAQDHETYVHRIGRTGRAGRSGVTVLFVTPKESRLISQLERHTRQRVEKMSIPNDHTIQQVKQTRFLARITERLPHEHMASYQNMIEEYLKQNPEVSAIDVAATLALQLNQDKSWSERPSFPKAVRSERPGRERERSSFKPSRSTSERAFTSAKGERGNTSYPRTTFRLDVGRIHGVKPGNIVGAIANEAGLKSSFITGLKIHEDYSVVCLPKDMPKEAVRELNKAWVCGRQLNLTPVNAA